MGYKRKLARTWHPEGNKAFKKPPYQEIFFVDWRPNKIIIFDA